MTAVTDRPYAVDESFRTVLVRRGDGLELVRPGLLAAGFAHLHAGSLDERIAGGEAPEASLLLAVRAAQLTAPRARRRLAGHWDELAARARRPRNPFDQRTPMARRHVAAAADQIHAVAELLRSDRPISARGVAIARSLLTTATSPVYGVTRNGEDVAAAVARAITQM